MSEGLVVKNYKELCKLMEEPIKGGCSKKSQLKDLETLMAYHKSGNKFIIDQIYDIKKVKKDLRCEGRSSEISEVLQKIILDYLVQKENKGSVFLPVGGLLYRLSMVNGSYTKCRSMIPKLSEFLKVDEKHTYEFYKITHSSLKSRLETALNQLKRKSLIHWEKVVTICTETAIMDTDIYGNVKLTNGRVDYSIERKYGIPATDQEVELILKKEREILKELNAKNKHDLMVRGEYNIFKERVLENLRLDTNITLYYESYISI